MRSIRERILKAAGGPPALEEGGGCSEVDPGEDTESIMRIIDQARMRGCSEVDPGEDTERAVAGGGRYYHLALQ